MIYGRNILVIGNEGQQAFGTFKNPSEVWTESRETVHSTKVTNNATFSLDHPQTMPLYGYTNATNNGNTTMLEVKIATASNGDTGLLEQTNMPTRRVFREHNGALEWAPESEWFAHGWNRIRTYGSAIKPQDVVYA